ncbi:MAG: DUF2283 domain-containing protein [Bellilinea sp.]|nr:DUF2283 domain-containing protein [Bellilinea sp.]
MQIRYFEDTDTLLITISNRPPVETQSINDNLYIDLDEDGRVVSITIEHASHSTNISELLFQRVSAG